jgi:hypothetical protein
MGGGCEGFAPLAAVLRGDVVPGRIRRSSADSSHGSSGVPRHAGRSSLVITPGARQAAIIENLGVAWASVRSPVSDEKKAEFDVKRTRPAFRALIDEMLIQLRDASGQEEWTPEARARAEEDLARIMENVRREAISDRQQGD